MSKNSCLPRLEHDRLIVIRESYKILCDYDDCAAALMNYYEYCHNGKLDEVDSKMFINKAYSPTDEDYMIQASNEYLMIKLLGNYGRNSIIRANAILESKGYIRMITNVKNPNGGKPINHIIFNAEYIAQRLKKDVEPILQRLKKDVATFKNKRSKAEQRLKKDVATFKNKLNIDILVDTQEVDILIETIPASVDAEAVSDAVLIEDQPIVEAEILTKKIKEKSRAEILKEEKARAERSHLHSPFIELYDDFHKTIKGDRIDETLWRRYVKDISKIRIDIIAMTEKKTPNASDDMILDGFKLLLERLTPKLSDFDKRQMTPQYLNSKLLIFIDLVKQNKNGNTVSTKSNLTTDDQELVNKYFAGIGNKA